MDQDLQRTTYLAEINSPATLSHQNREHKLLSQIFKENELNTSKWMVDILHIDPNTGVFTVECRVDEASAAFIERNNRTLNYEGTMITFE